MLLTDEPSGNIHEDTRDEIIGLLEVLWHGFPLTLVRSPMTSPSHAKPSRSG